MVERLKFCLAAHGFTQLHDLDYEETFSSVAKMNTIRIMPTLSMIIDLRVYCTYFGGHLVTWLSKKQKVVARSSTKIEFHLMASADSELTWLESVKLSEASKKLGKKFATGASVVKRLGIAAPPSFHRRTSFSSHDPYHASSGEPQTTSIPMQNPLYRLRHSRDSSSCKQHTAAPTQPPSPPPQMLQLLFFSFFHFLSFVDPLHSPVVTVHFPSSVTTHFLPPSVTAISSSFPC
ncbi:hypothetical protein KSP39_PZI011116 [Platanthera zijinensis]|uniref:Mitochondrial protein n=1 Tax=Platanthera zijinensis TaxID=2320716 RepID=A0AAP0G5U9_9ASPA